MEEKLKYENRQYSNAIGIEVTNIDVKMKFNYKTQNEIEPLCEVILSPEQAKMVSIMLKNAIDAYEEKYRTLDVNATNITKSEGGK